MSERITLIEGRKILKFSEQDFSVWVKIQMRFCDTDMMGHINNVSMIAFLETARVHYMNRLREIASERNLNTNVFSVILAEITCVYKNQLFLHDDLEIGIRIPFFMRKSFPFDYVAIAKNRKDSSRIIAEAQSIQVMFDYSDNKSLEVPQEFIEVASHLEGKNIPVYR